MVVYGEVKQKCLEHVLKKNVKNLRKVLYYTEDLCSVKDVGYRFIEEMYYTQNNGEIYCCGYKVINYDYRLNLGGL